MTQDDASQNKHRSGAPWRNFYGRLKGKGLRDSQQEYLNKDLADLSPGAVGWEENPDRTPIDLKALFGGKPVWLETGFGGGEHMVHQAATKPRDRDHWLRALHQRCCDVVRQNPRGRM